MNKYQELFTAIATFFTAGFSVFQYRETKKKEKMADFRCEINISSINKGYFSAHIHFKNVGKSDAKNVRIEMLPTEDEIEKEEFLKLVDKCKWGSYKFYKLINSGSEKVEEMNGLHISKVPKTLTFKITWDDDYENNRSKESQEDLY